MTKRKAILVIDGHIVKEQPTGGWSVAVDGASERLSVHESRNDAVAAVSNKITQAQMLKGMDRLVREGRAEHTTINGMPALKLKGVRK